MAEFKIQRGVTEVPTGGTTEAITAVADLDNAFAFVNNNRNTGAGDPDQTGNHEADDIVAAVYLSAVDELTFEHPGGSALDTQVNWVVIEYTGSAGGDNEFIVRSRDYVEISSGTTGSATLTDTPDDIDRCIPFIQTASTTVNNDGGNDIAGLAYLSSTATLNVQRGGSGGATRFRVITVEFTGSNWSVGHGIVTGQTADSGTIDLVTAAAGTGGSTFTVSDWTTAVILGWGHAGDDTNEAIADCYPLLEPGTNGDEVDYTFDANHDGSDDDIIVHVLQHDDMVVTRYSDTNSAEGAVNVDVTSAGLSDLTQSFVRATAISSGTGTAYARGWRNYRLTSTTNVEHWCHRSGNSMDHRIQVVDWSGITASGTDATVTPSSVDATVAVPVETDGYVDFDGSAGYAIRSGVSLGTGDKTIILYVRRDDWSPASNEMLFSQWDVGGANRSDLFQVTSAGQLQYTIHDGTSGSGWTTAATGWADGSGRWIRIDIDVDNGASDADLTVYTATDSPDTDPTTISWGAADLTPAGPGAAISPQGITTSLMVAAYDSATPAGHADADVYYVGYWRDGLEGAGGTQVFAYDPRFGEPDSSDELADTVDGVVWDHLGGASAWEWQGILVTASSNEAATTVSAPAAIPLPTIDVGSNAEVTATAVAAPASIPSVSVQAGSTVSPSSVDSAAAIPLPTVDTSSNVTVTPATVSAVAAIPLPGLSLGSSVTPTSIDAPAAIPLPTVDTTSNVDVAATAVPAPVSIPLPTLALGAVVDAVSIPAPASIPLPTITTAADVEVTPVSVDAPASIPSPAVSAAAQVAPGSVDATAAIPLPGVSTGATVTPGSVDAVVAIPTPTVTAGSDATVTPATVSATAAVPAPTIEIGAVVTPATVTIVASIPAPVVDVQVGTTVTPLPVTVIVTIAEPFNYITGRGEPVRIYRFIDPVTDERLLRFVEGSERAKGIGLRRSEGWERLSFGVFAKQPALPLASPPDLITQIDIDSQATWGSYKNDTLANLSSALESALQAAGYATF